MNKKTVGNEIKNMMDSLVENHLNERESSYLKDGRVHQDLSLSNFEENYFFKIYPHINDLESEISIQLKEKNIKISQKDRYYLNSVLIYGEEIMGSLTDLFKDTLGWTCSADRSRHVMRCFIKSLLGEKYKLKPEGKYTYMDPLIHTSRYFRNFIINHPLVNIRRVSEFVEAHSELKKKLIETKLLVTQDNERLANYLLNEKNPKIKKLHSEVVEHDYNRNGLTYREFAQLTKLDNLRFFLKECQPWVISLYKKRKV